MKNKIGAADHDVNYESAGDQHSSHKKQQFSSRFGNSTIPGPESAHKERQRSRSRESSSNMKHAPPDTYGTSELHARNLNQHTPPVQAPTAENTSFRQRIEGLLPDRLKTQYQLQKQLNKFNTGPLEEIHEESNGQSQSQEGYQPNNTTDLDYYLHRVGQ